MKKTGIISLIVLLLVIGVYKYAIYSKYNNLIKTANTYMDNGEYDKAIDLYHESLSMKKVSSIENSIRLANRLKENKNSYDEGINLMGNKKYLEAIKQFEKIGQESGILYTDAINMIEKCTEEYSNLKISEATAALENNKYDEESKYIAETLEVDNNKQHLPAPKENKDNTSSNIGLDFSNNGRLTFPEGHLFTWEIKSEVPLGERALKMNARGDDAYIVLHNGLNVPKGYTINQLANETFALLLNKLPGSTMDIVYNNAFVISETKIPIIIGEFSAFNKDNVGIKELCAVAIINNKVFVAEKCYLATADANMLEGFIEYLTKDYQHRV